MIEQHFPPGNFISEKKDRQFRLSAKKYAGQRDLCCPAYFYLTQRLGEKSQGIILLHHALLSFPKWDLWTRVCGVKVRCEDGVFQYHQKETVREHIAEKNHPITKDMQDFSLIDETYIIGEPQEEGNTVLITTDNSRSIQNLAWTRSYKNSRIIRS